MKTCGKKESKNKEKPNDVTVEVNQEMESKCGNSGTKEFADTIMGETDDIMQTYLHHAITADGAFNDCILRLG